MRTSLPILSLAVLSCVLSGSPGPAFAAADDDPILWPEPQRALFQDGPGLLLTREQRERLLALDEAGRAELLRDALERDPLPETPDNELATGIERRRQLVLREFLSLLDGRAQVLFLHGQPAERRVIDCGTAFVPSEVWTYQQGAGDSERQAQLVFYQPAAGQPHRLWRLADGKRSLYTPVMASWLEQWEELGRRFRRFDVQVCRQEARLLDRATGIVGLRNAGVRYRKEKEGLSSAFTFSAYAHTLWPWQRGQAGGEAWLAVDDVAAWARAAAATELQPGPPRLATGPVEVSFPEREGQRIVARAVVRLDPADLAAVEVPGEGEGEPGSSELRLAAEGVVEREGRLFEDFRVRYVLAPQKEPFALAVDRALRPGESFVLRLRLRDEGSGAETVLARGFTVPREPRPEAPGAGPAPIAGQPVAAVANPGPDGLVLLPPVDEVVVGLWRAEALVTGRRIARVVFLVDGVRQLVRSRPPFTAELRLAEVPSEQVVRVEGYDEAGELVAADQVVLNQARGALRVDIVEPPASTDLQGKVRARADVTVPEERRVEAVEFRINDRPVATLTAPPWEAEVEVPREETVYLSVVARLDDGSQAEDVRFLRAPEYVEEIEVDLIELYVTVTGRGDELVRGLTAGDFEVLEGGERQEITKFELVENLPLTVGLVLDTSGSMASSLSEAEKAAADFLASVIRPGDRSFAMTFAGRPVLRMPLTDDVAAVGRALKGLQAVGATSLHDAVLHALQTFRGVRGQRALVLLSDGDDTSSSSSFDNALEYARRSGVAIFAVGLDIPRTSVGVRNKLAALAADTGGEVFFIGRAEQLQGVYERIELELRSRYLLAFQAQRAAGQQGFRPIEVRVLRKGLKARTARGYYP